MPLRKPAAERHRCQEWALCPTISRTRKLSFELRRHGRRGSEISLPDIHRWGHCCHREMEKCETARFFGCSANRSQWKNQSCKGHHARMFRATLAHKTLTCFPVANPHVAYKLFLCEPRKNYPRLLEILEQLLVWCVAPVLHTNTFYERARPTQCKCGVAHGLKTGAHLQDLLGHALCSSGRGK